MNEHIDRFREFLKNSNEELVHIAELLRQADKSRADELMDQLNSAKHSHTELQRQLDEFGSSDDASSSEGLLLAYDTSVSKLRSLLSNLKQQLNDLA